MKVAKLVCAALALYFVAGWSSPSSACDNHKGAKVSATAATPAPAPATVPAVAASKEGLCTTEMAANCTPEMMAACKASMAAGGKDLCVGMKATAVAASAGGDCCAKGAASAKTAKKAGKATTVTAVAASAGDHCATTKVSAVAAGSNGACGVSGAKASTASAGSCSGHGMASMAAASGHADCEACVDMADCSGALDAAGAHRQAVRLKNGVMYVYTADSPRSVSAVQAAVARRADRMVRFASAGEKTRLCAECKLLRGAVASGKLNREVVNIEGGSLTLLTSSDPKVIEKIHSMSEDKMAVRVKS